MLLHRNTRYYERCTKETLSRKFSILFNDSDLRKIDLHESSKRTALIEQKPVVHGTPCSTFFLK